MKFELSSLTDIRFAIFDKISRGACIEEKDCNGLLKKAVDFECLRKPLMALIP